MSQSRPPYVQLISILLLLLTALGVVLFILPLQERTAGLVEARANQAALTQMLETELSQLAALQSRLSSGELRESVLESSVPVGPSQAPFIDEISEIAEARGFDLNAMNFSTSTSAEFGSMLTASANLSGNFENLDELLTSLENATRALRVLSMNIQLTGDSSMVLNLNMEAYYQ